MRVIVAGSRSVTCKRIVENALYEAWLIEGINPSVIVSEGARGVDTLGAAIGRANKLRVVIMPANWNLYGKRAGFVRNEAMASPADALVAVWDGVSPGTKHMISVAEAKGLKVYVHRCMANA